ncbi:unnamed protein product [Ambrosiozyma monospora]|uniref:Unnamed protein product n=1 Tax=Ambrosiozyma monospora TaxID=43982 RepID=A0ACB5U2T7_AMBMO|nr:unnamed protein product [Ambrosiozyma monospora]
MKVLNKNDTYNSTSGQYAYPQTPSRIQISIWPGGDSANAPGTIAWAGGAIDWDASDFSDPGYLYAMLDSVEVDCYDPPSGTEKNGTKSYQYKNDQKDWTSDTVMITDEDTIIGDLNGSGLDKNLDEKSSSSSSSKSSKTDSSKTSSGDSSKTSSSGDDSSESSTSSKGSNAKTTASTAVTDFVQNFGASSSSNGGAVDMTGMFSSVMGLLGLVASYILL